MLTFFPQPAGRRLALCCGRRQPAVTALTTPASGAADSLALGRVLEIPRSQMHYLVLYSQSITQAVEIIKVHPNHEQRRSALRINHYMD